MDVQEAHEANSVLAEKRIMQSMHAEVARPKPGNKVAAPALAAESPEDLCSVVLDVQTKKRLHVLPRPVYSVSPDGQQAVSFNFSRLNAVQAGEETNFTCLCHCHAMMCHNTCANAALPEAL